MDLDIEYLKSCFYKGNHIELLERTYDSPKALTPRPLISSIAGSLAFTGRLEEAEILSNRFKEDLEDHAMIEISFYLAIGYSRVSDYKKVRSYLSKNLRKSRNNCSDRALFYIYQGLGFYRFFCGQLERALMYSKLAYEHATKDHFQYGRVLSSDLYGHSYIKIGEIHKGIKYLKQAKKLSLTIGAGGVSEAIDISLAIYDARYSYKSQKILNKLKKLILKSSEKDSYSLSQLYLEISKVYILKGNISAAKVSLNKACQIIYSSKNYRHEIEYNIRYGYIYYLEGEYHQALNLLGNARRNIDFEVDKLLELPLLGMEIKVLLALGLDSSVKEKKEKLLFLTSFTGELINKRILKRKGYQFDIFIKHGEDRIGDIIDSLSVDKSEGIKHILESGYYGLFKNILKTKPKYISIFLDIYPGSIIIEKNGTIDYIPSGLTKTFRRLIKFLSSGARTKKEIITEVWNYAYDPIMHDSLIYTNILRLKRLLGNYDKIIEITDSTYSFANNIKVEFSSKNIEVKAAPIKKQESQNYNDLNYRQLQILEYLTENKFLDVRSCKKLYQVSIITASRDLSELTKLFFISRVGKGRSTKYTKIF
ncbi:MAG: DeoR family transcriptional regulator [Bacteriovoracaceae bacterium]|jgi:hypothetical protein|nr:DeoR family transcriptional regulator [Bacteriovoracaceae bacterium]